MSLRTPPLPVSGREVAWRAPKGADDLFIQEASGPPARVALSLVRRLARSVDRTDFHAAALTVTDFEVLLLHLHAAMFGSWVACGIACPHPACGTRLEIPFRIGDYLADIRPRTVRGVEPDPGRPSWFRQNGHGFRLPTIGDQVAVLGKPHADRLLAQRCIDPLGPAKAQRSQIERAMAAMAPEVSRTLEGKCPECGAEVQALLHVPSFVVTEMRRATVGIYEEVHRIANGYHWSEAKILALPRPRRQRYAERIRPVSAEIGSL